MIAHHGVARIVELRDCLINTYNSYCLSFYLLEGYVVRLEDEEELVRVVGAKAGAERIQAQVAEEGLERTKKHPVWSSLFTNYENSKGEKVRRGCFATRYFKF